MYSCNPTKQNQINLSESQKKRMDERLCRFSGRYDPMHQDLGCQDCPRKWDTSYLKEQGLLK